MSPVCRPKSIGLCFSRFAGGDTHGETDTILISLRKGDGNTVKQIYLYGDSNTYGYVYHDWSGGRYPETVRWTGIVKKALEEEASLLEDGLNGRPLPSLPRDERKLSSILSYLESGDLLFVMLGTNDIAYSFPPDPEEPIDKMNDLLRWLKEHATDIDVLVIAPPCPRVEHSEFYDMSLRMNEGFETLCREYGFYFADAERWNIPMQSDGIHFSEEGHRIFAEKLLELLHSDF